MILDRKPPLITLCGPTASGKTDVGIELALALNGEIVSADSMQVYRGMDIATAKPTHEQLQTVPHHLVGFVERRTRFTLADYLEQARSAIADIHSRGKLPIVVGGTGLYISSLVDNLSLSDTEETPQLRNELELEAQRVGGQAMLDRLDEIDPETASTLHANNLHRIIRALESYIQTGVTPSEQRRRSRLNPSPYDTVMLGIGFQNRELLYDRINRRVDMMLENGLFEEAREFFDSFSPDDTSAQAIGLKELMPFFQGSDSLENCVEAIRRETRRYAKRQMTWFRRDSRILWFYRDDEADTKNISKNFLEVIAKRIYL